MRWRKNRHCNRPQQGPRQAFRPACGGLKVFGCDTKAKLEFRSVAQAQNTASPTQGRPKSHGNWPLNSPAPHNTIDRTIYNALIGNLELLSMAHITANELKTRGIAAIEALLGSGCTEAVVSVRGTDRYVVMELAQYQHLRECELEAALAESRADIAAGRSVVESPDQHLGRLQALIVSSAAIGK